MIYECKLGNISIENLILKESLYRTIKLSLDDLEGLMELKNAQIEPSKSYTVDCFCPKCNKITTFIRIPGPDDEEFMSQPIRKSVIYKNHILEEKQKQYKEFVLDLFISKYNIINMLFKCSKNEEHHMQVSFYIDKDKKNIQKIGQFPSHRDFNNVELENYYD